MSFQKEYQEKLCSAQQAVQVVQSGDWIDYGISVNIPTVLDQALAQRAEELEDINIRTLLPFHPLAIFEANDRLQRRVFTDNAWHISGFERKRLSKGDVFYSPLRYCELPELYRRPEDIERVDVLMIQTTRMDPFGYFNFGPTNSHIMEVARRAKKIIVEANAQMPFVPGLYDEQLHLSQIDAIVETDSPLDTIGNAQPTETDRKIAALVLKEIPNGATLQLGIGGMPNAVGEMIAQSDLKDLGIHTEMYVDSMIAMSEAGVVTGARKSRDRGKQVFAFAAGSQKLYDYMNHNPEFLSAPVDYVNSPEIVASFDQFISINNAIETDLFGQINAESVGARQISGTGGQLDFVIGAYNSRGGKSIMAMTSTFTDKSGNVQSRIVPTLAPHSVVTDPRTSVHYLVTENGIFNCKGKSLWQRAEGIIGLAAPEFRESLIVEAEKIGIWRKSNQR